MINISDAAKFLMVFGGAVFFIGLLVLFFGKFVGIGNLPGDILIKKENVTFYFPITTSIIISIILSFIFFLWNQR